MEAIPKEMRAISAEYLSIKLCICCFQFFQDIVDGKRFSRQQRTTTTTTTKKTSGSLLNIFDYPNRVFLEV